MSFEISVESLNEVERNITIDIPRQMYEQRFNSALQSTAGKAHLKGFRPGRAPKNMVLKMYGGDIHQDVMSSLLSLAYQQAVKDHDLKIVGMPEIDRVDDEKGKDLKVIAKVALLPQPEIKDYDKVSAEVEVQELSDHDVEHQLEHVRERFVKHTPVEGRTKIEKGDVVRFSYKLVPTDEEKSKAKAEETDSAQSELFWIRDGQKPEELTEALVGKTLHSEFNVTLKVGGNNAQKAGEEDKDQKQEERTYSITPTEILTRELPEVTDAFVVENKIADSVSELKEKIRKNLQLSVERENKQKRETAILEAIAEKNTFLIPQLMIDNEIKMIFGEMGFVNLQSPEIRNMDMSKFREGFGKQAEQRVRRSIILDRLLEQEKIKATEEDVQQWINEEAERAGMPTDEFLRSAGIRENRSGLNYHVSTQKLLAQLLSNSKLKEKKTGMPACADHPA